MVRRPQPSRPRVVRRVRALPAVAVALVTALAVPAAASAHAQLQQTSPARDSVVRAEPPLVSFTFDEAVSGTAGAVRVFDTKGDRVDDAAAFHPEGAGSVMAVKLRPGLPHGTYTATYRVVSADTHVVTGGVVFAIDARSASTGASVADLLAGQRTGRVTSTAFTAARAVQYGAIGVGAGTLLFLLLVWPAALGSLGGDGRDAGRAGRAFAARARRVLVVAAAAGLVSAVLGVLLQGAESAGVDLWHAATATIVKDVLHTRFGTVWAVAAGLWAAVLAAAVAGATARPRARAALGVPLAALLALPALAGHASVQRPVWLFLPANLLHVAAMSAWLGGLTLLLAALPAATARLEPVARTRLLGATLRRFSPLALGSVLALLGTGTIQALIQIDAFSELLHTPFGRAVLVKIGLLLGLIGLGAVNRQRTLPRLAALERDGASPGTAGVVLRRTLRAEVAAVAVVLLVTGALAGYAPAKDAGTGPVSVSTVIGPADLNVDVDPARVGSNAIHVYLFDRRSGAQYAATKQLTVTASLPAKHLGPLPLTVSPTGPGHFTIDGAVLAAPGTWTLTLTARVSDFDQYEQRIRVRIR